MLIRALLSAARPRSPALAMRDPDRAVCFMHIPKASGTAFIAGLTQALDAADATRGFDRVLFGGFTQFDSFSDAARQQVYDSAGALPRSAAVIAGHFAYSTLRAAYPDGQLLTILREPVSRLMSHWVFWRKHANDGPAEWGAWTDIVRHACRPLATFLAEPQAAAQTDNLALRMLLWPHPGIPVDGFIDPGHDRVLLQEARRRLDDFAFIDIIEGPGVSSRIEAWLDRPFAYERHNATANMPPDMRTPFEWQLSEATLDLLDARSRLDKALWQQIAARHLAPAAVERLRQQTTLKHAARYGALMA
jgi:hypothetical protein